MGDGLVLSLCHLSFCAGMVAFPAKDICTTESNMISKLLVGTLVLLVIVGKKITT